MGFSEVFNVPHEVITNNKKENRTKIINQKINK